MSGATGRPDRILIAIVSAIALLVIVAMAVVFSRGEPQMLDESTPAGVVQRYSIAAIHGDTSAANAYLSEAARPNCSRSLGSSPQPARVVLVSTTERDFSAMVTVSIVVQESGGPFGPAEYETEGLFSLVKTAGKWRINEAPYQLLSCVGLPAKP